MNRIGRYYHGYNCDCGGCCNCEPRQEVGYVAASTAAELAERDAWMFELGRRHEIGVAQAIMVKMQEHHRERIEAAYHEGQAAMAGLVLVAGVCVAVAKFVIG